MSDELSETAKALDSKHEPLLLDLLHEIRRLNHVIKSSSEILSRGTSGKRIDTENVRHHSEVIFDNSYLVSLWLDLTELEINPDAFAAEPVAPRNIYGKFQKTVMSFRRIAKHKHITFTLTGTSSALIDCYPVIDILPYVLLDNAVKYSPTYSNISIEFFERIDEVRVSIASTGPLVDADETENLAQKYFRGKRATKYRGSGRGLFFAKFICDLHGADFKIEVGSHLTTHDSIPFGNFLVRMRFPR